MKRNKKGKPLNNERLEFLGDAILDAVVGDIVYQHFPGKREGFLTSTRSKLVKRDTLNKLAIELGLQRMIMVANCGNSHNSFIEGNAFEALVGAIYLDKGYGACMKFMQKRVLGQMIDIDKVAYKEVDFKSKLLEWAQKNKVKAHFYLVDENNDKKGNFEFTYGLELEGVKCSTAKGYSKKESQQIIAKETLEKLKKEPQFIDEVFSAKTNRTKMEEEPIEDVPETESHDDFIISSTPKETTQKHETVFKEEVFKENNTQRVPKHRESPVYEGKDVDDFDLSDIHTKAKTAEEIVAAAEDRAYETT